MSYYGVCDHKGAQKIRFSEGQRNPWPDLVKEVWICVRCHQIESIRLRYPPRRAAK